LKARKKMGTVPNYAAVLDGRGMRE